MKPDTLAWLSGVVTACFIGTWFVLGIGGFLFFHMNRDAALKRRWFPRFVVLGGVLFIVFSTSIWVLDSRSIEGLSILLFTLPAVSLITWLNLKLKLTRFCDACGGTNYHSNWLRPMNYCSACGAKLDPKPKVQDDLLE